MEDIHYEDIQMTNVDPAVTFTCYYTFNSAKDPAQKAVPQNDSAQAVTEGTPVFRNISVSHLTATCQRGAGIIIGLPESMISNVVFKDVKISAVSGMEIKNATGIQMENVRVTADKGEPFILRNAQVTGL